jgi:hypothetical protein
MVSMSSEPKSTALYHNLDTSFVNLWGLLRKLSRDGFIGRVRVELKDYTADVFMDGSGKPLVHEMDHAAGTDTLEEAALHRLVLRTREAPGKVSVFEGAAEANANRPALDSETSEEAPSTAPPETAPPTFQIPPPLMNEPTIAESQMAPPMDAGLQETNEIPKLSRYISQASADTEWTDALKVSGELIAAVERAVKGSGGNFPDLFRVARVEMADDYPFLDPTSNEFYYVDGLVILRRELAVSSYVAALSELLRRMVNRVAAGERAGRIRERVALELALVARKHGEILNRLGFLENLDRIAGTKVM